MRHHAFVIEAEAEEGIRVAQGWVEKELGMTIENNPDVTILRYGLFSSEGAHTLSDLAAQAPFAGEHKALIISASRAYHEAQNALLKLFEEPPAGVYLFLILPSLGGLLPTLRSRVQVLEKYKGESIKNKGNAIPEVAEEFMKGSKEKRSALIKKIAAHSSGDAVGAREQALAIVNGIEHTIYNVGRTTSYVEILRDIQELRGHLYDRSAPVRMILEHLSLVTPKNLI